MYKSGLIFLALHSAIAFSTPTNNEKAKIARICSGCHGVNGKTHFSSYPHLAGQNKAYLENQLKAFRAGSRTSPIMSPMAKNLNNNEISQLAEYYSGIDSSTR